MGDIPEQHSPKPPHKLGEVTHRAAVLEGDRANKLKLQIDRAILKKISFLIQNAIFDKYRKNGYF
jgi:hypothetical protein